MPELEDLIEVAKRVQRVNRGEDIEAVYDEISIHPMNVDRAERALRNDEDRLVRFAIDQLLAK